MIEVVVDSIRANPLTPHRLLVLKERAGPRYLVLGIGPLEAEVIAIRLQGIEPPRPLIHDLLSAVLERFGARLRRVEISELAEQAFDAQLVLEREGDELVFDARPSDAIALALRAHAPLYAAQEVLEQAGQLPETEAAEQMPAADPALAMVTPGPDHAGSGGPLQVDHIPTPGCCYDGIVPPRCDLHTLTTSFTDRRVA